MRLQFTPCKGYMGNEQGKYRQKEIKDQVAICKSLGFVAGERREKPVPAFLSWVSDTMKLQCQGGTGNG